MTHQIKQRILCIITQSEMGGAQQFLLQLTHHLDPTKYSFSVVVGGDGGNTLQQLLPNHVPHETVSCLRRDIDLFGNDWRALTQLRQIIKRHEPDIVLLLSTKAGILGSIAARFVPTQHRPVIVYRIGGWTFNDPWPWWKKKLYTILETITARLKDYIIVNSTSDALQAVTLGIRPRQGVLVIHNGIAPVDPPTRETSRETSRESLQHLMLSRGQTLPPQTTSLIGVIANFYPTKGLSYLLQAAKNFPDSSATIIIGDGPLREELTTLRDTLGLRQKVFFVGRHTPATQYMGAFDVLVLPSVKEGFPWVVIEAMMAKVPVIATRVGAIPEIIPNNEYGIVVPPKSASMIAEAVTMLLADTSKQELIGIKGRQQVLDHFSLSTMIQRYESLFDHIALRSPTVQSPEL